MSATTKVTQIVQPHDSEVRLEGSERIIGDLGLRGRDARNQRRLSGIGKSDQADVSQQLQLQAQALFLARFPRLVLGRSLMSGGGEVLIAASAAAPARYDERARHRG